MASGEGISLAARWRHLRVRAGEYLRLDCRLSRTLAALGGALAGFALFALGVRRAGLRLLTRVHRSNASALASRRVERFLGTAPDHPAAVLDELRRHVAEPPIGPAARRHFENPEKLVGTRALVVKAARERERGIIVLDYTYTFPIFANRFDVEKVAERYHVVLEPSWAGYCDLDILSYAAFRGPVFVQSTEPRDTALLERFRPNLTPVPVSGNWWVDHRVMRPLPGVAKDVDFVYVGAWARYKRHEHLFHALSRLRRRGEKFAVLLIGYPSELTRDDIFRLAKDFSLASSVELRERLTTEEVNVALNRAKVNVLWSRREGFNRAVIEGLFAGTPCVIRAGHNFGHRYPYVNARTGCFATEAELPDVLARMRRDHQAFAPRAWVLENMSCQVAARVLGASIRESAAKAGEEWTADPVAKLSHLDGMTYWDPADRERFASDYEFLRGALRR